MNTNFAVFHKIDSDFGIDWLGEKAPTSVKLADFEKVAEVRTDAIGEVFRLTNHIDWAWWENPEVTLTKKSRSTSVGDLVITSDGLAYLCDWSGWAQVKVVDAAKEWKGVWND
jgi:hypothetical protein